MIKKTLCTSISVFALLLAFEATAEQAVEKKPVEKNYAEFCASCHGADRLGGAGSALLPGNLERLRRPDAFKAIAEGRNASQMQGFADKLGKEDIQALVDFIYTPLAEVPAWGKKEINASHLQPVPLGSLPGKPAFSADPLNLFVVVELGDHHVTILDGDKFEPIYRFKTRFALHGGPKFSPDGRFVYFASRDGWIMVGRSATASGAGTLKANGPAAAGFFRATFTAAASSRRPHVNAFSTHTSCVSTVATRATCCALVQPTSPASTASRSTGNRSRSSASRLSCQ